MHEGDRHAALADGDTLILIETRIVFAGGVCSFNAVASEVAT